MSSAVYAAACQLSARLMGEFDGLVEIAAASARDWNDGTLDSSCVVYAAARHLSPPAISTGEFEDFVEIAAATLRVSWTAWHLHLNRAVRWACRDGAPNVPGDVQPVYCVSSFRTPLPPRGVGTLEFRRRQPSCVSGFVACPGASQRSRCSGCQSGWFRQGSFDSGVNDQALP